MLHISNLICYAQDAQDLMADDCEAREQKTLETIKLSCLPTYPGGVSWSLDDRISVITDQCVYILVSFNILTHYKLKRYAVAK